MRSESQQCRKGSHVDLQEKDALRGKSKLEMLEFQAQLLSIVDEAIVAVDKNDIIVIWNEQAAEITGLRAEELVGLSFENIFDSVVKNLTYWELKSILQDVNTLTQNVQVTAKDGAVKYVEFHIKKLFDQKKGIPHGMVISFRDVSKHVEYEQILQQKEMEYLELIDSSSEGLFIFDQEKLEVHLSEHWKRILGFEHLTPQEVIPASINCILPEDLALVKSTFLDAFTRQMPRIKADVRIRTVDMEYKWLMIQCKILYMKNGMMAKCFGTIKDIHNRKYRELHLAFLEDIGTDLFHYMTNESMLNVIGDKTKRYFGTHALTISYFNESSGIGEYVYDNPQPDEEILSGTWQLSDYANAEFLASARSGQVIAVDDIALDPFLGRFNKLYEHIKTRAMLIAPLVKDGKITCFITMRHDQPRHWLVGEIQIFQELAMRVFLAMERISVNEALQVSEERFRKIVTTASEGIALSDINAKIVYVNDILADMLGYSINEILGKHLLDFFEPEIQKEMLSRYRNRKAGISGKLDTLYRRKDGSWSWLYLCGMPIQDTDGRITGDLAMFTDITERKKNEMELTFQARLLANVHDAICAIDKDGIIVYWNDMAENLFGWTTKESVGKYLNERIKITVPEQADQPHYQEIIEMGYYTGESEYFHKDGRTIYADVHIKATTTEAGEANGAVASFRNITDRMLLEEERRRTEEKYFTLFNSIDESFCIIDMIFDPQGKPIDFRYLETNAAFNDQYLIKDVEGKLMTELIPDNEAFWCETYGKVALTGESVRFINEAKALNNTWYDTYAFKVDDRPGSTTVGVLFRNITEEIRNNQKLAFQAKMLDNVRDAVIVVDEHNVINYWNNAGEVLFGLNGKEKEALDHSNIARIEDYVAETLKDRADREDDSSIQEITCFRSDGSRIAIDVNSSILTDPQGEYKGMIVSCRDVSQRNQAYKELQRSEKKAQKLVGELRKADEMKTQFLSMLSHELRNPLTSIMLSLGVQERATPNGEQDKMAREIIKRQSTQLSRLVEDLLDVSRITYNMIELKKERLELNELVMKAAQDYDINFGTNDSMLLVKLENEDIFLEVDRARLIQVIGNLLHNAAKFSTPGGKTTVTVARDENAGEAIIRVKDEGLGVPPELLPNLFKPFMQADSSLDRKRGGLGLGLAIVKGYVDLHQGSVAAYSEGLGKGTEINIRLPLSAVTENTKEKKIMKERNVNCSFRILVIDDIKDIATIIQTLLQQLGHKVETAHDGNEGLEKAKNFQPDIIICDIGLPGINGYDLARMIRKNKVIEHDVFLIALTGYAHTEDINQAKEAGFDLHIAKPIDLGNLEQIISDYSAARDVI